MFLSSLASALAPSAGAQATLHSLISQRTLHFLLPPSLLLAHSPGRFPAQWAVRFVLMAPFTLGRASAWSADVWIVADMPWGCSPLVTCCLERRVLALGPYFVARVISAVEFSPSVI